MRIDVNDEEQVGAPPSRLDLRTQWRVFTGEAGDVSVIICGQRMPRLQLCSKRRLAQVIGDESYKRGKSVRDQQTFIAAPVWAVALSASAELWTTIGMALKAYGPILTAGFRRFSH